MQHHQQRQHRIVWITHVKYTMPCPCLCDCTVLVGTFKKNVQDQIFEFTNHTFRLDFDTCTSFEFLNERKSKCERAQATHPHTHTHKAQQLQRNAHEIHGIEAKAVNSMCHRQHHDVTISTLVLFEPSTKFSGNSKSFNVRCTCYRSWVFGVWNGRWCHDISTIHGAGRYVLVSLLRFHFVPFITCSIRSHGNGDIKLRFGDSLWHIHSNQSG